MQAIELLGGCCVLCGYKTDLRALEFDHVLPTVHGHISVLCKGGWPKVAEELKRCQLLCATCHAIKSWGQRSYNGTEDRQRPEEVFYPTPKTTAGRA